jgi:hypothetical protein
LFKKQATKEFVFVDAATLIFVNVETAFHRWLKNVNTEVGSSALNFVTMKMDEPMILSTTQHTSVFMNMDTTVVMSTVNRHVHYTVAVPFCL